MNLSTQPQPSPINCKDASRIARLIEPRFEDILGEYNFRRYPAAEYQGFQTAFSALTVCEAQIEASLRWKWGHWCKSGYPRAHRNLVQEIADLWPAFCCSHTTQSPQATFDWWRTRFGRNTTFITAAYITHLIHYRAPFPIIDQHNFRAMNALMRQLHPSMKSKKKPTNWTDIASLKAFMLALLEVMPNRTFSELDRFLMMYGRNHVTR